MRSLLALYQFRWSEGEVTKLLLVDGRDQRVVDGREGGLFLGKIWVKVVDILWSFLEGNNKELFISRNILVKSSQRQSWVSSLSFINTIMQSVKSFTYNPGLEGWLHFFIIQLLPIDASEEGVAGHGVFSSLWGHAAQTPGRVFGQEL